MNIRIVAVAAVAVSALCVNAETVAWWHFNELSNGSPAMNGGATVFNAVDSSKYALTAGVLGTDNNQDAYLPCYTNAFPEYATWISPDGMRGEDNRGMYFNPEKADGGVGCGSVLYTEVAEGLKLSSVTVELFVKADYKEFADQWKNLIVMGGSGEQEAWALRVNANGTLAFRSGSVSRNGDTGNALDGEWHHLAFSFDADTKTLRLYFDYSEVGSRELPDGLVYADNADGIRNLEIGSFNKASWGRWRGWVDEVRISNAALQPSEFLRVGKSSCFKVDDKVSEPDTVFYSSFDIAIEDRLFSSFLNTAGGTNVYPACVALGAGGRFPELCREDLPYGHVHSGIFATNYAANTGYWDFATNAPSKSAMIDVDDVRTLDDGALVHDFTSSSCTLEMFIRPSAQLANSVYLACQHASGDEGMGSVIWQLLASGYIKMELLGEGEERRRSFTKNDKPLADGNWHHVALVFDRDAETASMYVDYRLAGSFSDFLLNASVASKYSSYLQLFGGFGHNIAQQMQGGVDDVRITKRALQPHEFLTNGTVEPEPVGRTRAWISFDGDYKVKPRTNDIPVGVATEGVAFETAVPKTMIVDGEGNVLSPTNKASASISREVNFARNILADSIEMRAQTLEFFIRLDEMPSADYCNVFRFNDGETSDAVYGIRIHQNGDLDVRVDTVGEKDKEAYPGFFNQGKRFSNSGVTAGKWHHVAFTFEPDFDNNKTVIALYRDYAYMESKTANGILRTVGGGELQSTSFTVGSSSLRGCIDEIRISQGVLDVKDMMRATRSKLPFAIVIR